MRTLPRAAAVATALALLGGGLAVAPAAQASTHVVTATTVTAVAKTRITKGPVSVSVRGTQKATFAVRATGTSLRYQWQVKAAGKTSFVAIKGATRSSYTTPALINKTTTAQYRVVVTGKRGKVTSAAAKLTVRAYAGTKITQQPKSATIRGNATASFSVKAAGEGLRYQWQTRAGTSGSFGNVKGATAASYKTPKQANKNATRQYRVLVTGKAGKATSSNATLRVSAWVKPTFSNTSSFGAIKYAKGTRYTLAGKNLAGATITTRGYDKEPVRLKVVARTDSSVTVEVTATGNVSSDSYSFQQVVVTNPGGSSTADVDLHLQLSADRHALAVAKAHDFVNRHPDFYGSDRGEQIDESLYTIAVNEKRWQAIDDEILEYLKDADWYMDCQEALWGDPSSVEYMEERLNARDDLDESYEVIRYWVEWYSGLYE